MRYNRGILSKVLARGPACNLVLGKDALICSKLVGTCTKGVCNLLLQGKREEFWDTQPAYGGHKGRQLHSQGKPPCFCCATQETDKGFASSEIWDALRAVTADLDNPNNQLILDSAGIIVHHRDLSSTYDERGWSTSCQWCGTVQALVQCKSCPIPIL